MTGKSKKRIENSELWKLFFSKKMTYITIFPTMLCVQYKTAMVAVLDDNIIMHKICSMEMETKPSCMTCLFDICTICKLQTYYLMNSILVSISWQPIWFFLI